MNKPELRGDAGSLPRLRHPRPTGEHAADRQGAESAWQDPLHPGKGPECDCQAK